MAYSSLVTTKRSNSYYTSRGNTKVKTITLHSLPGYLTTESLYNYIDTEKISYNYIIAYNGVVGLSIDESNAATGINNATANKKTISIVVSAERLAPYELSTTAINSLTSLLLDICIRYNLTLVWNSSSVARAKYQNGSNINFVSDFTDEPCYDTTLLSLTESLVHDVNEQLSHLALAEQADENTDQNLDQDNDTSKPVSSALIVSKDDIIVEDDYLSSEEAQAAAKYIWQHFGNREWTLNAVAAMLGNMQRESTINPVLKERPLSSWSETTKGYGLTQWTPATKLFNWCSNRGLDYTDIDSQLLKIEDEVSMYGQVWSDERSQWINTNTCPISFPDFTKSTEDVAYLTEAFVRNYERPAGEEFTKLLADYGNITGLQLRQKWAQEWYDFLLPYSTLTTPVIYGLHLKSITADGIEAKCFLQDIMNELTLQLEVLNTAGTVVKKDTIKVLPNTEYCLFNINDLLPNTNYSVQLVLDPDPSNDGVKDPISNIIYFKTQDGRPEAVDNIELTALDLTLPDHSFRIDIDPPADWGYWVRKNAAILYGYDIQFIVNDKVIDTKTETFTHELSSIVVTPTDKKYFSVDNIRVGDVFQIGVRTWVINNKNETLYSDSEAKTTRGLCMLSQKGRMFLVKD